MLRTVEAKLYPTDAQAATLSTWLRTCCWIYNRCLEQRIKAYKRRGESRNFSVQSAMLTGWRERIERISSCPLEFARDALRRVDRGFKAFFRRMKAAEKPGFPRFHSCIRYNSLECLATQKYVRSGDFIHVPKLGLVKFRAGDQSFEGTQRLLRVIRRASGWFAQVLVDDGKPAPDIRPVESSVGIDVGLNSFATLDNGEKIPNPRWARKSARRLRSAQRRLSRSKKGSKNRRKAVARVGRVHERVRAQRKDFCHQESRKIVDRFELIAVEKLNVSGMAAGHFAKSISDAAWAMFIAHLTYKAANAGRQLVAVNPSGTSQECPDCGRVKKKLLSERTHECACGLTCDRDESAARVILLRAVASRRGVTPVEDLVNVGGTGRHQIEPVKQEVLIFNQEHYPVAEFRHQKSPK